MCPSARIFILFIIFSVSLIGCAVPKAEYDDLQQKYVDLKKEYDAKSEKMDAAVYQISGLQQELEKARFEKADAADSAPSKNENMPKFDDPDIQINTMTGAMMISDSILFATGQVNLKDEAKSVLAKLVKELNAPEYSKYMIRVDGHTDDQPVVKTKEIHRDNWLLSAKRAHSVMEKLVELGVDQERFIICGWGSTLPVEPNQAERKGNSKNRRVEIMLVKKPGEK